MSFCFIFISPFLFLYSCLVVENCDLIGWWGGGRGGGGGGEDVVLFDSFTCNVIRE